eukprot:780468_1
MASRIKEYVKGNDVAVLYFKENVKLFIALVVFSGSVYPMLALLSSRFFALQAFNSGLTTFELRQLSKLKLYGSVLAENCPQFCCQLLYIIYLDNVPSQNTILSMVASLLSIIAAVLSYLLQIKSPDCFPAQYDLEMAKTTSNDDKLTDEEKTNISQNKERKRSWRKAIASVMSIPQSSLELGYVTMGDKGCTVHVVHYPFKQELHSMNTADNHNDDVNIPYEKLAKVFVEKLYMKHARQINEAFNEHFSFDQPDTMEVKVQYNRKLGNHLDLNEEFQVTNHTYVRAVEYSENAVPLHYNADTINKMKPHHPINYFDYVDQPEHQSITHPHLAAMTNRAASKSTKVTTQTDVKDDIDEHKETIEATAMEGDHHRETCVSLSDPIDNVNECASGGAKETVMISVNDIGPTFGYYFNLNEEFQVTNHAYDHGRETSVSFLDTMIATDDPSDRSANEQQKWVTCQTSRNLWRSIMTA